MKTKHKKILWITIPLIIIGIFAWDIFLKDIVPMSRHNFKDFKSFRAESGSPFFSEELPGSATDVEYYWHSGWFIKTSGYRARLSADDYDKWKKAAELRYNGYRSSATTEYYKYDDNLSEKKIDLKKLGDDGIGFAEGLCGDSAENCYVFLSVKSYSSVYRYYFGIICNDDTNEIIEFYYKNSNSNSFDQ